MSLFSERYGYVKPRDVLVRECINIDIQNAICSAFDNLRQNYNGIDLKVGRGCENTYTAMEMAIWIHFLNNNGSLKFEITAKRLYAASQRVL